MITRKFLNPSFLGLMLFSLIFILPAVIWAQDVPTPQQDIPQQEAPAQQQDVPTQEQDIPAPPQDAPAPQPSVEMREDFSDDELKSFVKANEKVMAIQMEGEKKMVKAIEDEGLTVNRFNEILEQQRDPQRGSETSAEEMKSFNNAAQVILEENTRLEKEMTTTIEEAGIDIETYKQIMLAYQQSPEVQGRVNKMVNGDNK